MPEYEQSITVQANANQIFDFISDVRNMPKYLPTVQNAEPQQGERVRMQGQARGHQYDSDGRLHVDRANNRMEWGSDGEHAYSGWMTVESDGDGRSSSQITVHLSFAPPKEMAQEMDSKMGGRDNAINEGLQKALQSIQNEVEGKGGKVPSASER